uniref:Phospholipase D C-terminal domain-containing protein n=1 Tax=Cannabis sativa TaxID=3483 RepID=A0A803PCL1_CANSA
MSLWAEHMGTIDDCFTQPESIDCVKKVRSMGEMNWKQFAVEEVTEMRGHLLKYPVEVDRKGKGHRFAILCVVAVEEMVFSGSEDTTIRIWRGEEGNCLHEC